MLYLKNSLVNLTIIFFSLFFLTIASTADSSFIFPKKKIITIVSDEKKENNIKISKNFKSINLPQKNPFRKNSNEQKKIRDDVKISELNKKKEAKNNINILNPSKTKSILKKTKIQKEVKPFLESVTQKKIQNKIGDK